METREVRLKVVEHFWNANAMVMLKADTNTTGAKIVQ